jgi:hypothetical protein
MAAILPGIAIGIGIDSHRGVLARFVADGIATPTEPRQHGDDPVEHDLGVRILLGGQSTAHLENILDRTALPRGASGDLEVHAPIAVRRLAVAFSDIERDRLRCTKQLFLRTSMPVEPLAEVICPTDVLDGGPVDVQSLVPEAHDRLDSEIPIPTPTQMQVGANCG